MQQKKTAKKLQLNLETLKHVVAGSGDARIAEETRVSGCTVDTTCGPCVDS